MVPGAAQRQTSLFPARYSSLWHTQKFAAFSTAESSSPGDTETTKQFKTVGVGGDGSNSNTPRAKKEQRKKRPSLFDNAQAVQ